MPLFLVVVVVGVGGALAEEAVVEVVIAGLAGAEVRFDIRAADDLAAQEAIQVADGLAAEATEGQIMVGGARITVRYATIPRLGVEFRAVLPQLVVKSSPAPAEAKPLLGEDRGEVPGELFAVPREGWQAALAVRAEVRLGVFVGLAATELRAYVGLAVVAW